MFYSVALVSAIHQALNQPSVYMNPPSWTSHPLLTPSHLSQLSQTAGSSSCVIQQIPTGHLFYIWECISFSAPLSICPTLSFPATVSTSLFSIPASLLLPCKKVHQYHFSRFHIYALIYNICLFLFWLAGQLILIHIGQKLISSYSSLHD